MEDKELNKELICNTLGQGNDKKKYYVYMLCDADKKPFYIGKGEGGRIWQHEEGAHAKEEEIDEEVRKFEEELNKNSSDEEEDEEKKAKKKQQVKDFRSKLENELSEKYKRIKDLGSGNVTKVIVKWGLTNDEAYMVESALINMYKFIDSKNPLTNIANGHMSKKEKENRYCKTEAQKIEDFETNCVEPAKPLSEILDVYQELKGCTVETAAEGCGILFVKINHLYPNFCKGFDDEKNRILDAASGFWDVAQERLDKIEYVFALYQSQIVGIYSVNKDEKNWIQKKDLKETKKKLPSAIKDIRESEYKKIKNQIKNRTLEKGKYRMFFEADLTSEDDKNRLTALREKFIGKYIDFSEYINGEYWQKIFFNFEANGEFKKKKTN